jgi:hypothetical protein
MNIIIQQKTGEITSCRFNRIHEERYHELCESYGNPWDEYWDQYKPILLVDTDFFK